MAKGVKGSGTKPLMTEKNSEKNVKLSPVLQANQVTLVEPVGEYTRCKDCRSTKWQNCGKIGDTNIFQCGFCKRVLVAKEIPRTNNPLEVI